MQLKQQINTIRTEIKQLWSDLGISYLNQNWQPINIKSNQFNQNLLEIHKEKRDKLLNKWNEITNDLDNLLIDLDIDESDEEKNSSIDEKNNENSIARKLSKEIDENDIYSWTADGKTYRLLNDKERELVKQRAELRHQKFVQQFRQFKQEKRQQLEKEMKDKKNVPSFQMIRQTRRGYAFIYSFLN